MSLKYRINVVCSYVKRKTNPLSKYIKRPSKLIRRYLFDLLWVIGVFLAFNINDIITNILIK